MLGAIDLEKVPRPTHGLSIVAASAKRWGVEEAWAELFGRSCLCWLMRPAGQAF